MTGKEEAEAQEQKLNNRYKFRRQIGKFVFSAPGRGKAKYDVHDYATAKYITSFGHRDYEQYKDRIGYYTSKDHGNLTRLRSYYSRHGLFAKTNSAKFFAHEYLW